MAIAAKLVGINFWGGLETQDAQNPAPKLQMTFG